MKGWYGQSHRHYLAAKGITTKRFTSRKYFAEKQTTLNGFQEERLTQLRKKHGPMHVAIMRRQMKQGANLEEAHQFALEKDKTDVMGLPRNQDVKLFDFDKAEEVMHPKKQFRLSYMINDDAGNPVRREVQVEGSDQWDAKVKFVENNKDAYNLQIL